MGFHEVQLPTGIAYGAVGGPGYATQIIETAGGREERISRMSVPKRRWNITKLKDMSDISILIDFFVAREGAMNGFRFQDPFDYSTAPTQAYRPDVYAQDDVEIGIGDGTETAFQLVKKYTSGATTKNRTVSKPQSGKLLVEVDGVLQTISTHYSIDTTTGIITFVTAPPSTHIVKAGFQFDVPVRFSADADQSMDLDYTYFETGTLNVGLVEIIDSTQANESINYGGAIDISTAAGFTLSPLTAFLYAVSMTATSQVVDLPDPTNLPAGGPYFSLINDGSNSFDLEDHAAASMVTLAAGDVATIVLAVDAGGTKIWYAY